MDALIVHSAATLVMVGVIWTIQLVHYPLFAAVGEGGWVPYAAQHTRRITWVVAPAMLVEAGTAVALVAGAAPSAVPAWMPWTGVVGVAVLWASTWALQVPAHRRLGDGFDASAHRFLVTTNWLRTTVWTGRAALVLLMVRRAA